MSSAYSDDRKYPSVEVEDDDLLVYLKLCKMGYAKSVREAEELGAREVLQAFHYEDYCNQYEIAYGEINKP